MASQTPTVNPSSLPFRGPPTSLTWVSSRQQARTRRHASEITRRGLCYNSPLFGVKFNIHQHRREWEAGEKREKRAKALIYLKSIDQHNNFGITTPTLPPPSPPIRNALDGKITTFSTNLSTVLMVPTIFCPQWRCGKKEENIAPWPSQAEMKYEGADRISTDVLHRRFLGAPRVVGNATVNWQHRAIVPQFAFDDFLFPVPTEVDVWMRWNWVEELEFTDEEGREAIGRDLMDLLDPMDQFLG